MSRKLFAGAVIGCVFRPRRRSDRCRSVSLPAAKGQFSGDCLSNRRPYRNRHFDRLTTWGSSRIKTFLPADHLYENVASAAGRYGQADCGKDRQHRQKISRKTDMPYFLLTKSSFHSNGLVFCKQEDPERPAVEFARCFSVPRRAQTPRCRCSSSPVIWEFNLNK